MNPFKTILKIANAADTLTDTAIVGAVDTIGGGVQLAGTAINNTQQSAITSNKMKQLAKFKEMLDSGLISEEDYNTKKAEILS
ncbi:MAG: SHOCT domain-containing protein [Ignavibacteria bacterium]|jgi:hypothetical protein|nr:SHOCT domain-containing protein [Ignavibacteria bacterium]